MKFTTLCMATMLAAGSVGVAYATPVSLITNGTFTASAAPYGQTPTQFGTSTINGFAATQFINGWVGNDGYEIWENNATDATTVDAYSAWGKGGHNTGKEMLWGPVSAPPNGATSFVALDGDQNAGVQASIGQQLNNLIVGQTYTVSFDWASGQMQSRSGPITSAFQVTFGNLAPQFTPVKSNPGGPTARHPNNIGFTGWWSQSFNFVANSSSAFLNFLAVGTPSSLPPMSLLSNVSVVHAVPEPPALAMFGGGLLGLGLLTLLARHRAQRSERAGGDGNIG